MSAVGAPSSPLGSSTRRQGIKAPPPVADEDEQEQSAHERQPVSVRLLSDLLPCELSQVVPEVLQQVLNAFGIALHLAGSAHNEQKQQADHDPRAEENLAMQVQIADLPVEVLTDFEFGKGQIEKRRNHDGDECANSGVDDGLKNQSGLVEKKTDEGRKELKLGKLCRCHDQEHGHHQLKSTDLTGTSAEPGHAAGE